MMQNIAVFIFVFVILNSPVFSFSQPITNSSNPPALLIEDFEDGNITKDPEWWTFGSLSLSPNHNPAYGKHALSIKGLARDWYVGGIGVYFGDPGKDPSRSAQIAMDIYGFGPQSGTLKIEFYDDDNQNNQIEQDPARQYAPIFDDRFAYELKVNWKGWKHISIPFSEFIDTNPEAGDNVWNPVKVKGVGGFLQMQFVALAASKTGKVNMILDNAGFN